MRGGAGCADWLTNGNNGDGWDDIPPAPERGPVPPDHYVAHVKDGTLFNAKTKTPGYKLTFEIIEGDYKGRLCWYDIWLTEKNKANAVRDLLKLGIKGKSQLELPLPRGIRCNIRVVKRESANGDDYNEVKEFQVIGIDPPQLDAFAPGTGPGDAQSGSGPSAQGGAAP
jgi:hypothetical protein